MANEVVKKAQYMTALAQAQETFTNMVVHTGQSMEIQFDEYQKLCVMNMIGKMQELITKEGLDFNQMDKTNITNILQTVAMLNLNVSSIPVECYLILRNTKLGDQWVKMFEMGIQGDGNDKLLRKYGVDVKKVYTPWTIREHDTFTYPSFNGLEITPPTWQPKDYSSKIVKVVYPIEKNDGQVEYHIAERESVVHNLQAHITNNLMKNKSVNDKEKDRLNGLAADMTIESILSNDELLPFISPAWKSAGSRESMIERKLRNNATKKYPKDFRNAFVATAYKQTYDDYEQFEESTDIRINKEEAVEAEVQESAMSQPVEAIETPIKAHTETKEETDVKTTPIQETKHKADDCPY